MKILALLLLFGLASAASLNKRSEEDDIKTELGKTLKEGLDRVLQKIKEAVDEGKQVKQELVDKVQELREKLREIKEDVGTKSKDLLRDIREKTREYFKKVLERLGLEKSTIRDSEVEALAELNLRDIFLQIKEHLKNNVDQELLKEKIEKLLGQGSELLKRLLRILKEKGQRKLEILIDSFLEEDDSPQSSSSSIKEYWEKIKNYFKDLKIDLQEKYMKFGEWVKENYKKGKESSKDKFADIKAIAKEFAKHAKNVSKEVGAEASEFFRQYKDELGVIWDELKEKFQEIRNRKD